MTKEVDTAIAVLTSVYGETPISAVRKHIDVIINSNYEMFDKAESYDSLEEVWEALCGDFDDLEEVSKEVYEAAMNLRAAQRNYMAVREYKDKREPFGKAVEEKALLLDEALKSYSKLSWEN